MSDERFSLESQIRECYGRAVYTHKTHERMADAYDKKNGWLKFWQIVFSAVTASGAITVVFADEAWLKFATAIISLITLFLSGYAKNFNLGALAQVHRETASHIWDVREKYLSLLADIKDSGFSLQEMRDKRDGLQQQLYEIYKSAPHTNGKAYEEAQDRLKNKEDLTFSDEEIDKFLPKALRRTSAQ